MKIKRMEKKLNLKKETVTNLDNSKLNQVFGGKSLYCSVDVSCNDCTTEEKTCDPEICSIY